MFIFIDVICGCRCQWVVILSLAVYSETIIHSFLIFAILFLYILNSSSTVLLSLLFLQVYSEEGGIDSREGRELVLREKKGEDGNVHADGFLKEGVKKSLDTNEYMDNLLFFHRCLLRWLLSSLVIMAIMIIVTR